MVTSQVKSNLAKLLATENLTVEHSKVSTASFNVETRVLKLPVWENISNDVYDLLVGHEVGHALFTPNDSFSRKKVPQSFVNVIEDARVERKIKLKYPGISRSFYRGYVELNKQDFFEIKDINLEKMSLIDRINLHFKIGVHDISTLIPFNEEEMEFVELTKNTETFQDVIDVCEQILHYIREKKEEKDKEPQSELNLTDNQDISSSLDEEEITPEDSGDKSDSESEDDEDFDDEVEFTDGEFECDEEESVTDNAWNRNTKSFVSDSAKEHIYIKPPTIDWDSCIESAKIFSENMDNNFKFIEFHGKNVFEQEWKKSFNEFKKESKKSVAYLVKEFEMKKRANEYSRSSESKTGILNTNKLFSYKWSDDVFKKNLVFPTGKNHGLIMYIDWSGSMYDNILGTVKQLINLITFCKKVNIPFQVFAFTDSGIYDPQNVSLEPQTEYEFIVDRRFRLVEMFNSEIKKHEFDEQLYRIWALTHMIIARSNMFPFGNYDLNGTPLNDTIFAAVHVFKKFKQKYKVDKVNTVFLSDGESNAATYSVGVTYDDKTFYRRKYVGYEAEDNIICIKDPTTGYVDIDIAKYRYVSYDRCSYRITASFIKYYKWMTKSNVVGFRLTHSSDLKIIMKSSCADNKKEEEYRKIWKTNKSFVIDTLGYDELYVIQSTGGFRQEEPKIAASSSDTKNKIRTQFKKYIKSKMFNKIILSKFVDQIA